MQKAESEKRAPGWDAKAIADIARTHYGSTQGMFEHFDWPERGSKMMIAQQKRVAEKFGSIENFVKAHRK